MRKIIKSELLDQYPSVKMGVSTKQFGNLSFQHLRQANKITVANRKQFFLDMGINPENVVNTSLSHGNRIYFATRLDRRKGALSPKKIIQHYDGLICKDKNIFLMVTIADCFPIFYFDSEKSRIGIAHSGWRGVLNNIAGEIVGALQKKFQSNPSTVKIFIGPGIQKCHFSVKKNLYNRFLHKFGKKSVLKQKNKYFVDLPEAITSQLIRKGILEKNIEISQICTYCQDTLFSSYRRDKADYIAQGAIIGLI